MIEYKKLKLENEDIEELDIDDIDSLDSFGDINFYMDRVKLKSRGPAIFFSYAENELRYKTARLSKKADWIIREYKNKLYLIPLKKIDC